MMPGIFGSEAIRLLRDDWVTAKMLAEELYAIITSPEAATAPLNLTQPTGSTDPIFNVGGISNGDTLFNFKGPNGEPAGTITINDGSLVFNLPAAGDPLQVLGTRMPKIADRRPFTPPGPVLQGQQQSGGGGFPGFVTGGTGNVYNVDIFPGGLSKPSINVSVRQLKIADGETIPVGEAVMVGQGADGGYFMQYPVWGASS